MKILHLTDLHLSHDNPFQKELISALMRDLDDSGEGVSAIIFSGDLVNNPDERAIFDYFLYEFLVPLLERLKLSYDRVALCPGNHDASRAVMRSRNLAYTAVQQALPDDHRLAELLKDEEFQRYCWDVSSGFFKISEELGHKWSNPLYHVFSFPELQASFVALNGAFGCSLLGSAHDRGRLAFPLEVATRAFQEAPEAYVGSIIHHTLGDFTESTVRGLRPLLDKRSSVHLFGHVHQPLPAHEISSSGRGMKIQGGALYERTRTYNGYSTISSSDDARYHLVHYRTYWPDRFEFDDGLNVVPHGRFYGDDESRSFWVGRKTVPTDRSIRETLLQFASDPLDSDGDAIGGKPLSQTFVEPKLVRPAQGDDAPHETPVDRVASVDSILRSDGHYVIGASHEYGSSSLLKYIESRCYKECSQLPIPWVPAYIECRKIKTYLNSLKAQLRASLPDPQDSVLGLDGIHQAGRLLILLDDFEPENEAHRSILKFVQSALPKARLIISAKFAVVQADHVVPDVELDGFTFLQIRPLNRNRVRTLVERWRLPSRYKTDFVVEEIITRFGALGIPVTGVYVAIYLTILDSVKGFTAINSSTVINQFVELVLEKYNPHYAFRSEFDYDNQIDYLGFIAEQMCVSNSFLVDYENVYSWTKDYFTRIGVQQDYSKIIDFFIVNKIFDRQANSLGFKYRLFESFFTSVRMQRSLNFKLWILDDYRFVNYVNEIDIYCGLTRNDSDLLDTIAARFASVDGILLRTLQVIAADPLETLQFPRVKDQESFTSKILERLVPPEMTASERDEMTDPPHKEQPVKPALSRPEVQSEIVKWILSLRAYSVAVKNLEHIPANEKQRHLERVLGGWAAAVRYACLIFQSALEDREISFGNYRVKLSLPKEIDAEITRLIFVSIPKIISYWVRNDLGSQKLELQLRGHSDNETVTAHFMRTALYADLKLSEYMRELDKLRGRVAKSEFFLEALLIKLRDLYIRLGLAKEEEKPFRRLVAEISADAKGLTGEDRAKSISDAVQDLERRKHLSRLGESGS